MLVDASWPPPDQEPDHTPFLPPGAWPFLTVALFASVFLLPAVPAYLCLIAGFYCAGKSLLLLLPGDGSLRDYKQ